MMDNILPNVAAANGVHSCISRAFSTKLVVDPAIILTIPSFAVAVIILRMIYEKGSTPYPHQPTLMIPSDDVM